MSGQELITQPLYDRVWVERGAPLETLRFFAYPLGAADPVTGRSKTYGLTNLSTPEQLQGKTFHLRGVLHRLVGAPRGLRDWWTEAAQAGTFELRIDDRIYLTLPLVAVPLLEVFGSPFRTHRQELPDVSRPAVVLVEQRAFHLSVPLTIGPGNRFPTVMRWEPALLAPSVSFTVDVMLLGEVERPLV